MGLFNHCRATNAFSPQNSYVIICCYSQFVTTFLYRWTQHILNETYFDLMYSSATYCMILDQFRCNLGAVLGSMARRSRYIQIVSMCKKVKVKVSLCLTKHQAMKKYWRSGGIAPRIPDLGTRWRWVVSFTSRPPYPQGKSPCYPLDRRLAGPQSYSGCSGEEKNSQPLLGIKP
jgi:hypothetical protein